MPTNILLDALRTRRGLKWGVPAMLIAAPYLLGAWLLTVWISDGGPGWLNLLVLLFIWNALKFVVNGPITLVVLIRARLAERRDRRLVERQSAGYTTRSDISVLTASLR
jgi:hypothetical protein